jgi:hypothetical protein
MIRTKNREISRKLENKAFSYTGKVVLDTGKVVLEK